jgi:catalase
MSFGVLTFLIVCFEIQAQTDVSTKTPISEQIVDSMTLLASGVRQGYRPIHAKGVMVEGEFIPSKQAAEVSKAIHFQNRSSHVFVRLSNASGLPNVADGRWDNLPKSMAIRFDLLNGTSTDILGISTKNFPVSTPEEALNFLEALIANRSSTEKPTPFERYLYEHPKALNFLTSPRPVPESFANQAFYSIHAFKFTNSKGQSSFGRYIISPLDGEKYLNKDEAEKMDPNYLMSDIVARVQKAPVKYKLLLELAEPEDDVNDASVTWPSGRKIIELGIISLNQATPNSDEYQRKTMFNPMALLPGIEPSNDPLLLARPSGMAISFSRRSK